MGEALDLYETDFIRWAESQAQALRAAAGARVNLPIDWENVAEEIESLGKSQRRELRSRLDTIIEHLLKLAYSPSVDPREGWRSTISRERRAIQLLLDDNRSLRREIPVILENALPGMADLVAEELLHRGEITRAGAEKIRTTRFSEAEVLERWFPTPGGDR
ncbi:DUF29 domain-containing protein [Enterovirga aerilata]|uniref:DUF29 domain-containing protein n=1 Tax=Enterovirga aerilata TaxID=2730920 RepID=A0A849I6J6_9HYPH|nr:DUF29 domain-containing protein [Enterovirga sp. DB1703]NNM71945.1 DUF29 domain-containing protein [Enterovirga sp. DB1703]